MIDAAKDVGSVGADSLDNFDPQSFDCRAASQLFYAHWKRLLCFVKSRGVKNQQDCEDILQETAASVFRSDQYFAERFDTSKNFSDWIFAIIDKKIVDNYRYRSSKKRSGTIQLENEDSLDGGSRRHSRFNVAFDVPETPEEHLMSRDVHSAVMNALSGLPDICKDDAISFYVYGMSVAQIIQSTQQKPNTVSQHLFYARKKLLDIPSIARIVEVWTLDV